MGCLQDLSGIMMWWSMPDKSAGRTIERFTASILDFFAVFRTDRRLVLSLIVVTLIGSAFGYYYYWYQFSITPLYLWLFVPDCPLFTTFFAFFLIGQMAGRVSPLFNAFTFAGLVKYGIWTVFVLVLYWNDYLNDGEGLFRAVLMVMHVGMVLLALTMVRGMQKDARMGRIGTAGILSIGLVFLVFDLFDYGVGTYPLIPTTYLSIVSWFSVAETFAVTGLLLAVLLKR